MDFYTHFFMRGNTLFLRRIKDGERQKEKHTIEPRLFIPTDAPDPEWKSFDGVDVEPIHFDHPKEARQWADENNVPGNPIYGFPRFEYDKINEIFPDPEGLDFDFAAIRILFLDIETECEHGFPNIERANEMVNAITIGIGGHLFVLGLSGRAAKYGGAENFDIEDCTYFEYDSEADLLTKFVSLWKTYEPDVITGWNTEYFDMPYLVRRIKGVFGEDFVKKLSPWNMVDINTQRDMKGQEVPGATIHGISHLDYLPLYKKFTFTMQESYKLDYIAHVELGEEKLDYTEEGGKLHLLYLNNYKKFLEYNAHDVRLIMQLEDKMGFIRLAATIAYSAKCNFQDVYMNVRVWDVIINTYLQSQGYVGPFKAAKSADAGYAGAYVKPPIKGLHRYISSFDLTSLYPSIIMQNNISPETMLSPTEFPGIMPEDVIAENDAFEDACETAKELNASLSGNGVLFDNSRRGFFPELTEKYFNMRKASKKKMLAYKNAVQSIDSILEKRKET